MHFNQPMPSWARSCNDALLNEEETACCGVLTSFLFRYHSEEGNKCRQHHLCKIKNWHQGFSLRPQASLGLGSWYLILLHKWGQVHHMPVGSLKNQNSSLALYFPFVAFWRNRSKFLFCWRRKENKGEYLHNTCSNPWCNQTSRTQPIHPHIQKRSDGVLTDLTPCSNLDS